MMSNIISGITKNSKVISPKVEIKVHIILVLVPGKAFTKMVGKRIQAIEPAFIKSVHVYEYSFH